ncbi:MAG: hypothetical protein AAB837_00230 [Patescibacteria group bacterium]
MIRVITKQKYAVDANNGKVFLSLKRIKKVSPVKYPEEENAKIAVNGKNLYQMMDEDVNILKRAIKWVQGVLHVLLF